jgi:flagellar biosynthesis/type III secretory pathway protein FliH
MCVRDWKALLLSGVVSALVLASAVEPADAQGRGRGRPARQGVFALKQAPPRGYQEPAFARGYTDGHQEGLADGRQHHRYDPADSREYRDGNQGYVASYGSRDAYRDNYRTGFRQGYEAGYREATR